MASLRELTVVNSSTVSSMGAPRCQNLALLASSRPIPMALRSFTSTRNVDAFVPTPLRFSWPSSRKAHLCCNAKSQNSLGCAGFLELSTLTNLEWLHIGAGMPVSRWRVSKPEKAVQCEIDDILAITETIRNDHLLSMQACTGCRNSR